MFPFYNFTNLVIIDNKQALLKMNNETSEGSEWAQIVNITKLVSLKEVTN